MPLSNDPSKRKRQIANLRRSPSDDPIKRERSLANLRPAPPAPPGNARHLVHGLRSEKPSPIVLDPLVREIEATLATDLPLKGASGDVPAPDRYMVELAAIQLLRVRRCAAYLELHGDVDEKGNMRPEFAEFGKAVEAAARMLDRLGCSPRARAALGLDLVRAQRASLDDFINGTEAS